MFIAAWLDEVGTGPDDSRAIEVLAAALTQHRGPDRDEGPLGVDALTMTRLVEAVRRMSERLLVAMGSTRSQMGDVAAVIGRLAQPALLPQLLALLAEDLRRWRVARLKVLDSQTRLFALIYQTLPSGQKQASAGFNRFARLIRGALGRRIRVISVALLAFLDKSKSLQEPA